MTKSDDVLKRILDTIGDKGSLKRRRFIGTSRQDQEPWSKGGLSFGIDGIMYGSCDFAWFVNENWNDPFDGSISNQKPCIVVEATDCLNTRSWGNAQIQRFHHGLGPFLCGVISVYYLKKGPTAEPVRPYLTAAAFYATKYYRSKRNTAAYLVTTDINDIKELVVLLATKGENSVEFQEKVCKILTNMLSYFQQELSSTPYFGNWEKYLESRGIVKCADGKWVKDLGPRKENFTDSSKRMGHIVVGEAITSLYLLIASGLFDPSKEILYYLLPAMTSTEISDLDKTRKNDKEWNILRKSNNPWKLIGLDNLKGVDNSIITAINKKFRQANLNKVKKEWNDTKLKIRDGLKTGLITIKI